LDSRDVLVYLDRDVHHQMLIESETEKNVETGGMLFGYFNIINNDLLKVFIVKTHIPPRNFTKKNRAYFEINHNYACNYLKQEELAYLGNWHKHLGYGGPSALDHKQISDFFTTNPHKNITMALVIDYLSNSENQLFIEIYLREKKGPINIDFRIIKPFNKNVQIVKDLAKKMPEKRNIDQIFYILKQKILSSFQMKNIDNIREYQGKSNERILGFSIQLSPKVKETRKEKNNKKIALKMLISLPLDFPHGEIYVDIASNDLTKMFTLFIYDIDSNQDTAVIFDNLISDIKYYIDNKLPNILEMSLRNVLELSNF
jgi:hypothetical protein